MNNTDNPQSDKSGIAWINCYEALDSSHTNRTDIIPFPLSFLLCYYSSNPIIIHGKGLFKIFLFHGKVSGSEYLRSELLYGLLKILREISD